MTPQQATADTTTQTLLQEAATVHAKLRAFLGDAQYSPAAMLDEFAGMADPMVRDRLLLYLADWYRVRALYRLMSRAHSLGSLDKLEAAVNRGTDPANTNPCCHYCKSMCRMLQQGLLRFQKPTTES